MKLLAHPTSSTETITMGGPEEVQVLRFSFPYFRLEKKMVYKPRMRTVGEHSMNFAGRTTLHPIEVDFETIEDVVHACLDEVEGHFTKKRGSTELDFEGVVYTVHGLFPLENLRANVWKCSIDHVEINK